MQRHEKASKSIRVYEADHAAIARAAHDNDRTIAAELGRAIRHYLSGFEPRVVQGGAAEVQRAPEATCAHPKRKTVNGLPVCAECGIVSR